MRHVDPPIEKLANHPESKTRDFKVMGCQRAVPRVLPEPAQTPLARALAFSKAITGRVEIIIDQSNMFQGGRDRGWRLDYAAILKFLMGDYLAQATMVVTRSDRERPQQEAFYCHMERIGYCVPRFTPLHDEHDQICEDEIRVDGAVRTLIRAAAKSPDVTSLVVFTGDGGATNAIYEARLAGKNVYVLAWDGTLNPALAMAPTDHITLEIMRPLIARVLH